MDARARDEDDWDFEVIESVDVGTIAAKEVINIEVSRKIYDRVGANVVAPAVVAPDQVACVLDREERRDLRDSQRRSNAARIAFKQFWD